MVCNQPLLRRVRAADSAGVRRKSDGVPCLRKQDLSRINPAVIVGVINGSRILITKYKSGFRHNALVAGFTEIGETVEETVRREVMEETGLRV